jgi:hypothetical protein
MTYIGTRYITGVTPQASFSFGPGILGWIGKSISRSVLIRRQRRQLHELSDHMLKDIGLSRADIDGISTNFVDGHADATRRRRGR